MISADTIHQYRWEIAAVATAAIVVAALIGGRYLLGARDAASSAAVEFTVSPGSGAITIGAQLEQAGIIRSRFGFSWYAALTGAGRRLQAGTYRLCPCQSVPAIVSAIAGGEALPTDIVVTIPEGMNVWEIDDIFAHAKLIIPGLFARREQSQEGTLFPDTYRFSRDLASASADPATLAAVARPLTENFQEKASFFTQDQVIIASILEKEAKTADDMALVSGIIQKRLKQGMPLQIDATVAYGWCLRRWLPMSSNRNCDVTQAPIASEVKVDGAYNTYKRAGLPPAPISNPGLNALNAAAHPKDSPYLYYLSTRDGSQLIYAKTAAEHLANRKKYLGF